MKFLRRHQSQSNTSADTESTASQAEEPRDSRHTPGKGRPTPKRRDAEGKRRGPVAPPPKTQREAMRRSRGNKEDRKRAASERRERMMSGDDRYLTGRDKGPVRAHVRDLVDARRNVMGIFMPLVLVVFLALIVPDPRVQQYVSLACMVMLLVMIVEGIMLGRYVNKRVRAKFPDTHDRPLSLGWYAFTRATQIRKLRMPRPRVTPKDAAKLG